GMVSGVAFGSDGVTPAPDVVVTLIKDGTQILFTTTDAAGHYAFDVLIDGTYALVATSPEMVFPTITGIALASGNTISNKNFQSGSQHITGAVRDLATNQPLAGASVFISRLDPSAGSVAVNILSTDSTGGFDLANAIPGSYTLTVVADGHVVSSQTIAITNSGGTLSFQLSTGSSLHGTIRNAATGAPLADAVVSLIDLSNPAAGMTAVTDASGQYQLTGVAPGLHEFLVQAAGYTSVLVQNITVGTSAALQDFALSTANSSVGGLVSGPLGGLSGAAVTIQDGSGIVWGSAFTNVDGTYSITGLPAGTYSATATILGYQASAPVSVTLSASQVLTGVNLSATPVAITDPEQAAAAAANLPPPTWVVGFTTPDFAQFLAPLDKNLIDSLSCPDTPAVANLKETANLAFDDANRALSQLRAGFKQYEADGTLRISKDDLVDRYVALRFENADLQSHVAPLLVLKQARFEDTAMFDFSDLVQSITDVMATSDSVADSIAAGTNNDLDRVAGDLSQRFAQIAVTLRANSVKLISLPASYAQTNPFLYENRFSFAQKMDEAAAIMSDAKENLRKAASDIHTFEMQGSAIKEFDVLSSAALELYNRLLQACSCSASSLPTVSYNPSDLTKSYGTLASRAANPTPAIEPLDAPMVCVMFPVRPIGTADPNNPTSEIPGGPEGPPDEAPTEKNGGKTNTDKKNPNDPNDFVGPAGFGPQGFIPSQLMPYRVDFENDPAQATAAAQIVSTTFTIDPDLDPATLQFTGFGFGQFNFQIPEGLFHYQTTLDLRPQGINLLVPVTLDENQVTGVVNVKFESLDPLTNSPPDGIFAGFLPIDNAAHDGQGYFTYTVQPKAALPTGTAITEQTSIVFDSNAGVQTPVALNTIDAGGPTSSVTALPSTSPINFTVNWSGSDDAGGSGIASYDISVSDNGGDYTVWQSATAATSATYNGVDGHTYRFYSIAHDNVGHVELAPLVADATTASMLINSPPVISDQSFNVAENSAATTTIGNVIATDPDVPTVLTYSITGGNSANNFTI
ncbi:MAG: repeat-associated core domain protein, partial [Planctomycetaceae bacterium]|nr:repeat-associated core domain protein [Planctomycetaceae bacterium]